jgi:hypothetical protein
MQWRRGSQSIPIDVKAVFHSSTWEPTILATSHWPIPCALASAPSSVDLDAAAGQAISACGGDARKTLKGPSQPTTSWGAEGGVSERLLATDPKKREAHATCRASSISRS